MFGSCCVFLFICVTIMNNRTRPYYIVKSQPQFESCQIIGSLWIFQESVSKSVILVAKYEGENAGLLNQIELSYLEEITYEVAHLLLAIPEPFIDRVQVVEDPVWIKEGLEISVGTVVRIYNFPSIRNGDLGTVRFKGRLPGKNGTSFGIELNEHNAGKGTTDGTFRHKKLFSCAEDCGIFVSIYKIRIAHEKTKLKFELRPEAEGATNNAYQDSLPRYHPDLIDDSNLQVGERIVWMSDLGAEFGTVKWIGILPRSVDKKVIVGVEFDNPVGTGTGKYKGLQLFRAKRHHASLLPVLGLLKASVYMSMLGAENIVCHQFDEYDDIKVKDDETFPTASIRSKEEWKDSAIDKTTSKITSGFDDLKIQYVGRGYIEQDDSQSSKTVSKNTNLIRSKDIVADGPKGTDVMSKTTPTYKSNELLSHSKTGARPKSTSQIIQSKNERTTEGKFVTMGSYEQQFFDFQVGSKVCITLGTDRYGVVRWMGTFPYSKTPDRIIAGIEMEIEDAKCYTDGRFLGEKVFHCPPGKGLFFPLNKCFTDTR